MRFLSPPSPSILLLADSLGLLCSNFDNVSCSFLLLFSLLHRCWLHLLRPAGPCPLSQESPLLCRYCTWVKNHSYYKIKCSSSELYKNSLASFPDLIPANLQTVSTTPFLSSTRKGLGTRLCCAILSIFSDFPNNVLHLSLSLFSEGASFLCLLQTDKHCVGGLCGWRCRVKGYWSKILSGHEMYVSVQL